MRILDDKSSIVCRVYLVDYRSNIELDNSIEKHKRLIFHETTIINVDPYIVLNYYLVHLVQVSVLVIEIIYRI